jgi:sRNA-binding regulator protein Hfq
MNEQDYGTGRGIRERMRSPVLRSSAHTGPRFVLRDYERQAKNATTSEALYFQKQMEQHTTLQVQLEDGEEIRGVIEWYDDDSIKLRKPNGVRVMIYKHCIKYLFKGQETREF